jgi:predicted DCC family thiol-disulfide oxidoreductase YuxK
VCVSLVRRFRPGLEKRGFGFAALQDPRVQTLLDVPAEELLREMRVAASDGKIYGGARAVIYLAGKIWWAWPLHAAAKLPGMPRVLDACYRWIAEHRTCASGACSVAGKGDAHDS